MSEAKHGDCELHIELNVSKGSNSGVYFQGQYEVQIFDSFVKKDKDLKYGDCGGIYNTAAPRTNASKAPGEWQSFHVVFQAPRFDDKGNAIRKPYTSKELKELTGPDKSLPGYKADVDSLKIGQIVDVYLGKKKNAGKNDPPVILMIHILIEPSSN